MVPPGAQCRPAPLRRPGLDTGLPAAKIAVEVGEEGEGAGGGAGGRCQWGRVGDDAVPAAAAAEGGAAET
jgi:hypothetical protein